MATSTLPSVLPIIPEDRPLPTSPTNPPPKSDSKWSTIRRVVKRYCTLCTCATTVCVCVSLSLSLYFFLQSSPSVCWLGALTVDARASGTCPEEHCGGKDGGEGKETEQDPVTGL